MSEKQRYFAADEPEVVISTLEERAKDWFLGIQQNSYLSKIERSWRAYYGDFFDEGNHAISFGGESGEIVNIAVNHYRNLARHVHVMVTSTRPAFQCRAVNTDKKSLIQAKLGNGLLDYYMREKRLEEILKQAVEYAIVLGSGYVKLEWNSTRGEIVDYLEPEEDMIFGQDEEGNYIDEDGDIIEPLPIYQGDVEFSLVSPYDVVFDSTKEYYDKNDWVVIRDAVNKYDLAAKYPEKASEILKVDTIDNQSKAVSSRSYSKSGQTESIYVKEFFHKRTESRPNGRYMLYIDEKLVLEDTDLPYRELPLFRIVPSSIMGTPYGYSDMFDLLPLQEFLNSMYSTAATNISAFGIQSILSPREAGVEFEQVSSGMQFIKYNAGTSGGKPEAMQLTATSPEVYQMMNLLVSSMETISGVNSVARGNPEQSLRSGTALALVQSQALQYVSGLQQSYVRLLEDVGTGLLNLLKDFAEEPRIAAIAGINNTTEMKTFKADDIRSINRVVVEPGNALMNSTAGRVQIAENLLQMGLVDTIDKYLMILNTGNLDYMTDGKIDNLTLIKSENEAMLRGEATQAIWSEKHSMHIKEHMELLNDVELKKDVNLVQLVLDHVQEHINLLQTTDPIKLSFIGETPLAPPPNPANVGQQGQPSTPPVQESQAIAMDQGNAGIAQPQNSQPANLPSLPDPAGEGTILPEGMPVKPEDL